MILHEHFVVYKDYIGDPMNMNSTWLEAEAMDLYHEIGEIMDHFP